MLDLPATGCNPGLCGEGTLFSLLAPVDGN
eukprot:COSAG06_NODE_62544_length_264_cov_2.181818_1_plen_29_part_10